MTEKLLDLIEWFFKPSYLLTMPQVLRKARIKTAIHWVIIGTLIGISLTTCYFCRQQDIADAAMRASLYERRAK